MRLFKITKLIGITLASVSLLGCSSPEDRARLLIADYCEAFKSNDVETLKELTTDSNLTNFSDSEIKKASCGEKIKKVSEDKYIFLLGDKAFSLPISVEKVDGVFQITGVNI
jgi:hypothetical protein